MADDSLLPFSFPAIHRRKITAAFDGGRLTSDGGVLLLAQADRQLGIAAQLARCIADPRDQGRITHSLDGILRARILAIACGYEDADDLDTLRHDPGFKLALGKLPDGPAGLASQPTMSRWENAPTTREIFRLTGTLVDIYCASYPTPPAAVTLDIDDTVDVVHGMQQLSFWNGHHGERCFLPIHVYDTETGRPVAMLLRTGKTPSGTEVAGHIRRLVRRIRRHWPETHITLRGDGHYGRPERSSRSPGTRTSRARSGRNGSPVAREVVTRMDAIFAAEREIWGHSAEERRAFRQIRVAPLVAELEVHLRQQYGRLSRKSDLAKAIHYMTSRWESFARFVDDGRICMTNNAAERRVRTVAIGRRNWTFCGSDRGGRRAAAMYSLIQTCRLNGVDPHAWLRHFIARISDHPQSRLHELLPWHWKRLREEAQQPVAQAV